MRPRGQSISSPHTTYVGQTAKQNPQCTHLSMISFDGGWCASNIDAWLELAFSSSIRKAAASRRTPKTLDTAYKSAGIQRVLGIELPLHRFHQGERVARGSPRIERRHFLRAMQRHSGTTLSFQFTAQRL